jgi:hypothetical protein
VISRNGRRASVGWCVNNLRKRDDRMLSVRVVEYDRHLANFFGRIDANSIRFDSIQFDLVRDSRPRAFGDPRTGQLLTRQERPDLG